MLRLLRAVAAAGIVLVAFSVEAACPKSPSTRVVRCDDFELSGRGDALGWTKATWINLNRRPGGEHDYKSRFKIMYSNQGIYVLFDGADRTLTATMDEDFAHLWEEDVFECFFWTDEEYPIYFEYEISPLNHELPILVPKFDGKFLGWRPWQYDGKRRTRKATHAIGGEKKSMSSISGWRAEMFLPYELFRPLRNVPARPGGPISTALITTVEIARVGIGPVSAPASMTSTISARSCSNKVVDRAGVQHVG